MTISRLIPCILACAFVILVASPVDAARFGILRQCECYGDYKPPRGVFKYYTVRLKSEWEHRKHCLPCGRYETYKVKVITFRDRFSDGSSRTWKCVVAGTACYDCGETVRYK